MSIYLTVAATDHEGIQISLQPDYESAKKWMDTYSRTSVSVHTNKLEIGDQIKFPWKLHTENCRVATSVYPFIEGLGP